MAKIFSVVGKAGTARLLDPLSRALLRMGVSPNAVTVLGTAGVLAGSFTFVAHGHFLAATIAITVCALTDVMDGSMARQRGTASRYGALLDSTMDRIADGAIFAGLIWWFATIDDRPTLLAALICLVAGQVVSYVKARAEGLGMACHVGLVERAERLIIIGVGALLTSVAGLSWGLPASLWLLAAGSIFTIWQRMWHVYKLEQAHTTGGDAA
ncbi:phosphatidylinositol phosphate synthase [Catellatospora tritici]|uniref:phosphatidylinositol phosphate synthase n=1 Tax=Catellatospora tritici TaxID=2851566 RepID=UPI001C2D02FF|nr:CDP-alcohol phosphatidyltransferase family protein [Catellatospora tritici]MBV1850341.1 CDP-alcohol phosphatidyltransferase family protein [Catellatospora tritici]